MADRPKTKRRQTSRLVYPMIFVIVAVVCFSVYANLAFCVEDQKNYQYLPPFQSYVNDNHIHPCAKNVGNSEKLSP